eukprot:4722772-Pyramimonas_sp.AAC.1
MSLCSRRWVCFKMTRDNQRLSDEKAVAGAKCDYHSLASCVEARADGSVRSNAGGSRIAGQ